MWIGTGLRIHLLATEQRGIPQAPTGTLDEQIFR